MLGSTANLMQMRTVVDGLLRCLSGYLAPTTSSNSTRRAPVQLTLKFLTQPQAVTPLDRLEQGQRVELVQTLAGIIAKAASRIGPPMVSQIVTTSPTGETSHD